MGTGLTEMRDYSSEYAFVDAFKSSHSWFTSCTALATPRCTSDAIGFDTGEEALLDLDPDGWVRTLPGPTSPLIYRTASTLLLDSFGHYPQGQYIVLYDGEGTIEYAYDATRDATLSTRGRDVLNVVPSVNGIYLNITSTDPNHTGNYIRNIRVIMPGFEQTYATQIFHPDFLAKLNRYRALRFLNWMDTTASTQRDWVNRPQLSEARWSAGRGVPLERMIQLANRLGAEPWFNMPHMATDEYVRQFATMVLNSLDPRRTVHIEYSNEVWNNSPPFSVAGAWVDQQAAALWTDPTIDPMIKRLDWYGMRAAQICDVWRGVFGADSTRLDCVIAGGLMSPVTQSEALDCPLWTAAAPCSAHGIRSLAVGAYVVMELGNPTDRADIRTWLTDADGGLTRLFNELMNGGILTSSPAGGTVADTLRQIDASASLAASRGVGLVAYEGGQSLLDRVTEPAIVNLFSAANRDPRMGAVYDRLLEGWRARTPGLFNHVSNVSQYGPSGAWGALEYLDLAGSPKFNALMRYAASNPRPSLASLTPSSVMAGGPDVSLTVAGSNFTSSSQISVNGAPLLTGFISPTQLSCTIPAVLGSLAGTYGVSVKNPAPGGGVSGAVPFTVNNPAPAPFALSPQSTIVGSSGFTLTIQGASFVSSSQVTFNGSPLATTYVSPSTLTAAVPAAFVSATGSYGVVVKSPAPGGGVSGALPFAVNYPLPVLSSLSPASSPANGPSFTLTLTGAAFTNASQVSFDGAGVTTTFVSPTQLLAAIPAQVLATGRNVNVNVWTPLPGGGTSAPQIFLVNNPSPILSSIAPGAAIAGNPSFTITAIGASFVERSRISFNGAILPTTFFSSTHLEASVPAAFISINGNYGVAVVSPGPGGGTSAPQSISVQNPAPVLSSIAPPTAIVGGAALTLTVAGSSFVNGSQVTMNGAPLTTTFVSSGLLTAAVPAPFVSATGAYDVTVTSAAPGGGTTVPQRFAVVNPMPALSSLSPAAAIAGGPSLTLTMNGSGFISGSQVSFNGARLQTTFGSPTQLFATVPAATLTAIGVFDVTVANATPGGGVSLAQSFTVQNPSLVLSSISPSTVGVGGADFTLTLTGTSFVNTSQAAVNGANVPTTFVSSTQLLAAISAPAIAAPGTLRVTVITPPPGGGTSAPRQLAVTNPAPSLSAIRPSNAQAQGPAFTLTLDGASFVATTQVSFNNTSVPTTVASPTRLFAFIGAASIGTAGTYDVVVTNPAPGGGAAPRIQFTVANATPILSSISPLSALAGGPAFTLTLNGAGFTSGAQAAVNGATLLTTYVAPTRVLASVPPSFISATGSYPVTVANPMPGGGASNAQLLAVNNPIPVLSSISPSSSAPVGASFPMTLTGTAFVDGSRVSFGGATVAATFVSSTQLVALIPGAAIASAGTYTVTVSNPLPGGGVSAVQTFTSNNETPILSSLAPSSVSAGGSAFSLTLMGSSFVAGSQAELNGSGVATTFVSSTQLLAAVPAAMIAAAGVANITVTSPPPGGGLSAAVPLSINNPVPVVTAISQTNATAGDPGFTLAISGSSFVNGSQVTFNGGNVLTTYGSATQLLASIPASALTISGALNIVVTNPAPGGGSSAPQVFSIANALPLLNTLSPWSVQARGADFVLTLNGASFATQSQVTFNTTSLATSYVGPTQLLVTVPAALTATAGVYNVFTTNPPPGGGASNTLSFAVTDVGPAITSLSPAGVAVGSPALTLTINGTGFLSGAIATFNGVQVSTTFVSATQLTASVPPSLLTAAGTFSVTAGDPPPTWGLAVFPFNVNNATPSLASISPASAAAGASDIAITLTGASFSTSSQVTFNGASLATTFVSTTQLSAIIPTGLIASSGAYSVAVTTPAPGGGTTTAQAFTVTNPGAVLGSISPSSEIAGAPAFTLTLFGSAFTSGAQANFNGTPVLTTFVSSTELFAAVPATAIAVPGTFSVTVTNPLPLGGTSAPQTFIVTSSAPVLNGLSPSSLAAGSAPFLLTINGWSFAPNAQVSFNTTSVTTSYVSPTQLTAAIPASLVATAGNYDVLVTNPMPGGGTSSALSFAVTNPGPSIASLSPSSAAPGGSTFTLTLSGASFVSGARVSFNGTGLPTTFGSPSQLTASVPASAIAYTGSYNVTVQNPAPGGGLAAAVFTVSNPTPVLSAISPAGATAGGPDLVVTLTGSSFVNTSQAGLDGSSIATAFVSGTQLSATIPAALVAFGGTHGITVTSQAPGGGTSAAQTLTINNPLPVLSGVSPSSVLAGGPAITITLSGSSFVNGTQASFNGSAVTTTFVSSSRLTAIVSAGLVASAQSCSVVVANPLPGGGSSAPATFLVNNPSPVLTNVSPSSAIAGGAPLTLTLNGSAFVGSSRVSFNGTAMQTTFVSPTQLVAQIPASSIAAACSFNVTVTNPAPGGGTTAALAFAVVNPLPVLSDISPSMLPAGSTAFTLTLSGSSFVNGTQASFNGTGVATTFVSATQITAAIPVSMITVPGAIQITVSSPAPGGGTSGARTFTISNAVPVLTEIFPASVLAGRTSVTVTLTGASFVRASQASFAGAPVSTTYVSPAQLTAAIPDAAIATAGTFSVAVTSPAPGGGTSAALTFTANNPVPVLLGLQPASAAAGGAAFTLTLGGSSFVAGSQVTFNGASAATTFVSATQLLAAIPQSAIATGGVYNVSVTNPAPRGGTSAALSFSVNNPLPILSAISPSSAGVGAPAFTMTLTGSAFVQGSRVSLNGADLPASFVSSTQLTAQIPQSAFPSAGAYSIVVTNPSPGGGPSTQQTFTAQNPVPVLASIDPGAATVGDPTFTLTLSGSSFVRGSQVSFNGVSVPATYISSARLSAPIPTSAFSSAGTDYVLVINPGPGGGSSAHQPFVVSNRPPVLASLSPASTTVGGPAFTLTVNGSFFVGGTVVAFNGANVVTTFVSPNQLTAQIPSSFISISGAYSVSVMSPGRVQSTSALPFRVDNPIPILTAISPSRGVAGGPSFLFSVSGSAFVRGAQVSFNGTSLPSTFVSSSQLTAVIPASAIAATGAYDVAVINPAPGGGASTPQTFTAANPTPVLSALSPASTTVGVQGFTLTISGASFMSGVQASFNGAAVATTFVSPSQVLAAIPGAAIAAAGSYNVTVTSPSPGGTSAPLAFAVNNPQPWLGSISPSGAIVGGAAFVMTLNGSSFVNGARATFNGAGVTTTFVSATLLTASIPAGSIFSAGVFSVTVTNPSPGGGASLAQSFTVSNPAPLLGSIAPASALVGGPGLTLTLRGSSFVAGSQATMNGAALVTSNVSPAQLLATVPASLIAATGTYPVRVVTPGPGGGTSVAQTFTVNNPAPVLASISPSVGIAGGAAFTVTLNGSSFVSSAQVAFNGTNVATTFVSGSQLLATIPASAIATAGSYNVAVSSPAPGGGTSTPQSFLVNNPVPVLSGLTPPSAIAGGTAFALTIAGSRFVNGSQVAFNGASVATTFVSASQLTAAIPASAIANAGVLAVAVNNPAPGGGASALQTFTVNNPLPVLAAISPSSTLIGGPALTITLNGLAFVNGSQATLEGTSVATTYVSPTQLTAVLPPLLTAATGNYRARVVTPGPGGGTSVAQTFTVNNPIPALTSLTPPSAIAGGTAFALTVVGSSFVNGSQVAFNGASVATTFVSASQLTAAIPASAIANAGVLAVAVNNPAPGGGASAPQTFTVNNPMPALTSLAPTSAIAGGTAFALTVVGSSFVNGSQVAFNGAIVTTTFVSASQLTAAIPASAIATAGSVAVTVTSPAPGGGTSAQQSFLINNPLPVLSSIAPSSGAIGDPAFTLTLTGSSFVNGAQATFNGASLSTTFVSASRLLVLVPAGSLTATGAYRVTVVNPGPAGGTSASQTFAVGNPIPVLASISPLSAFAGDPAFTMTLSGSSFVSGAQVTLNGANVTTTFVSATRLVAAIPALFVSATGNYRVQITNPAPGGGTSAPQLLDVDNPVPVLSAISPSYGAPGIAFTLALSGSSFQSGAQVSVGGTNVPTVLVSSTQLTAAIPASAIPSSGAYSVTVTNPAPGGGTSAIQTFIANNPSPILSALSPAAAVTGGGGFTLTLTGSSFVSGSQVSFNGSNLATTFVSATQLAADLPASYFTTAGANNVIVINAPPGGGASSPQTFMVNNPAPVIAALSQTSANAGDPPFTLIVSGNSFINGSQVTFNGVNVATTSSSATQLTAAIPASALSTAGTFNVAVTNPAPGGGTSPAQSFSINNPIPAVNALSPSSIPYGGPDFTLTLNGAAFVSSSQVAFNGTNVATSFVSATQLAAVVPAALTAAGGLVNVSVTNPAPGGASGVISFTVTDPAGPAIASLSPPGVTAGGADLTLTVNGSNFVNGSSTTFNGVALTTTYVSPTQLIVVVPASAITAAGTYEVAVGNPAPGWGLAAAAFNVSNVTPVLNAISPAGAALGSGDVTITLTGSSFTTVCQVALNGQTLVMTFISASQLTALIPAGLIASSGTYYAAVTTPFPGGGTTPTQPFNVTNPAPLLSAISPLSAIAGGPAITMTLLGSSFAAGAQVSFNGAPATTSFVSSTQLTAAIPAQAFAAAGAFSVTVQNPPPSGGTSAPQTFTVTNFGPVIGGLSPSNVTAGGAAFVLTINGWAFTAGAQAMFGGASVATTYVSFTQLAAAIPAALIAAPESYDVVVLNPGPGGGITGTLRMAVTNPGPVIASLSPAGATAGGADFVLTIIGSSFASGAVASLNQTALVTTFVSSSQLTAAVPGAAIASAGSFNVTVLNPMPGGGLAAAAFTISSPPTGAAL